MFEEGLKIDAKKAAVIIVVVLLVLVLAYLLTLPSKPPAPADTGLGESKNEIDASFKSLLEGNKGIRYGRPMIYRDGCEGIKDAKEKSTCLDNEAMSQARTNEDYSSCQKIQNDFSRDYCLGRVAWDKSSADGCNLVKNGEQKNQCLSDIAIKTLDKSLCAGITDDGDKKECEAVTDAFTIEQKSQDINQCFSIPQVKEYKNHCILTLTQQKGPSVCDSLDAAKKIECQSTYLLFWAMTQNNEDICNRIQLDRYKRVCLEMVNYKGAQSDLDSDHDGVDDINEIRDGTDPFDPNSK